MAKGLSRIALIVATIAVVMLISSCSDVTESSQSSNKEKSVTSLVGEIYHGDGYFILDENGLQIVKEGAAYDENKSYGTHHLPLCVKLMILFTVTVLLLLINSMII